MGAFRNKIGEQEPALSVSELVLVYEHLTVKLDSHPSGEVYLHGHDVSHKAPRFWQEVIDIISATNEPK